MVLNLLYLTEGYRVFGRASEKHSRGTPKESSDEAEGGVSSHAAAAPSVKLMNSRRLIGLSQSQRIQPTTGLLGERICASQQKCRLDVAFGSWLCENFSAEALTAGDLGEVGARGNLC